MHLLNIIGPAAAGKMTVGREVCRLTGFRLFHNHLSIEPLLEVFEFGTPSFHRLNSMIRREVIREAVTADLPGLVFSFVWNLDDPADAVLLRELIAPVVDAGAPVDFVELVAPLDVRLAREGGVERVDHKRSKRDVEWARSHTAELEQHVRANTHLDPVTGAPDWPWPEFRHVRLDNSHGDAATTARRIVSELGLPRLA